MLVFPLNSTSLFTFPSRGSVVPVSRNQGNHTKFLTKSLVRFPVQGLGKNISNLFISAHKFHGNKSFFNIITKKVISGRLAAKYSRDPIIPL